MWKMWGFLPLPLPWGRCSQERNVSAWSHYRRQASPRRCFAGLGSTGRTHGTPGSAVRETRLPLMVSGFAGLQAGEILIAWLSLRTSGTLCGPQGSASAFQWVSESLCCPWPFACTVLIDRNTGIKAKAVPINLVPMIWFEVTSPKANGVSELDTTEWLSTHTPNDTCKSETYIFTD